MKTTITKTNILKALAFAFIFLLGKSMNAQCAANFNYTINANGNVSFQSTSTPSTANCYWTFGNSQTSTLTSPATTYTANGTYVVNLFIWSMPSCSISTQQTITITNAPTSTCNLNASFTKTVGANGTVYFTNTSTNTSTLTSYHWNINNNFFSSAQNPTATLSNGYHTICLNVIDSINNCSDSYCDSVFITNSTNTCSLNANFNFTVGAGGNVSFASTSTGTSTSTLYNWWFGNSQSANTQNANTTYANNGWYTVCLFLSDSTNNCTDSYCQSIYVGSANTNSFCNASFTYSVGASGSVTLTSNSTGTTNNTHYYWTVNNSFLTYTSNPQTSTTFTNFFNYVCLTIIDSTSNCWSTYCDTILVPTNPCNPSVSFAMVQDSTQALTWWAVANYPSNTTNVIWNWGDNTSSTGFYPSHTYSASGFYNICVTITVSCAGTASFCSNTFINKSAEAPMPMYHVNVVNALAPTASIKNNGANEAMTELLLYPNPAKDQSHLKLNMNAAGDVTLSIFEITGKLVQQGKYNLSEGVNTIDMDTNTLAKGMYLVTINSGNAKKTVRLIKE